MASHDKYPSFICLLFSVFPPGSLPFHTSEVIQWLWQAPQPREAYACICYWPEKVSKLFFLQNIFCFFMGTETLHFTDPLYWYGLCSKMYTFRVYSLMSSDTCLYLCNHYSRMLTYAHPFVFSKTQFCCLFKRQYLGILFMYLKFRMWFDQLAPLEALKQDTGA